MTYVSLNTSTTVNLPGRKMWLLLNNAEHGEHSMGCSYIEIPVKQAALPHHIHEKSDEFIFIIEGSGHISCDGEDTRLEKGCAVMIEKGELHALFNDGDTILKALCIFSPPTVPSDYLKNE